MLLVLSLLLFAAGRADLAVKELPCGLVDEDRTALSAEISSYLLKNGFVRCADRGELRSRVQAGELDCGIVLLQGTAQRAENGRMDASALSVVSPMSFLQDVYKAYVTAALYDAAAPAMTYSAARELGWNVTLAQISQKYRDTLGGGYSFTFETETVDGAPVTGGNYSDSVVRAAAALLLFAAVLFGTCSLAGRGGPVTRRIGETAAARSVQFPAGLVCALFCAAAAWVPLAAGHRELLLPVLVYCLILAALGLLFAALLPMQTTAFLLPVWLLASLAMCPVYTDLSAMLPASRWLKLLLPPCWFYAIAEAPVPWLAAGAVLLPLSARAAAKLQAGKNLRERRRA